VPVGPRRQNCRRRGQHGRRGARFRGSSVRPSLRGRSPQDLPVLREPQQPDDDPAVEVAEHGDGAESEDRLAAADVDLDGKIIYFIDITGINNSS
jgi:hypothetical protein